MWRYTEQWLDKNEEGQKTAFHKAKVGQKSFSLEEGIEKACII